MDGMSSEAEPAPRVESVPPVLSDDVTGGDSTTKPVRHLGVDEMGGVQLIGCQQLSGRPVVEEPGQRG